MCDLSKEEKLPDEPAQGATHIPIGVGDAIPLGEHVEDAAAPLYNAFSPSIESTMSTGLLCSWAEFINGEGGHDATMDV